MVRNELQGWYVNNVYPLTDEGLLIRFHRSEMGNKSLALHPRIAFWITGMSQPQEGEISQFCRLVRKHLVRSQLDSCYAIRGERIVSMEFRHAGQKIGLFSEFFGAGNIIITDEDRRILALLHEIDSKERSLHLGAVYSPPKPKKASLDSLSPEMLLQPAAAGLTKLLGRVIQLPDRILKEVVARSGLSEDSTVTMDSAKKLISNLYELEKEANESRQFYLYEAEGKRVLSSVQLSHLGTPANTLSFQQMDEIFSSSLAERILTSGPSEDSSRMEREKKRIESAKKMYEATVQKAQRLKEIAEALNSSQIPLEKAGEMLNSLESSIRFENGVWLVDGRRRFFDNSYSLASHLFAESKKLMASALQINDSIRKMETALEKIKESREHAVKKEEARQVKRIWFESFRWFFTSESYLAVGGRDAGSNSLLVRKRMENEDLVFHAEVAGSPFFLLKRGKSAGQASIVEAATATVCYSRAWREGLSAADAYYVEPNQVKLGAPPGMYMSRGSFMIEGQRNYVKNIKLVLGVGITKIDGETRACSAPTQSISKYSPVIVEIAPGNMKPVAIAKKIMRLMEQHMENVRLPGLDEFLKVLPPGDSEVLGIKKGEGDSLPKF
jgi:predicted ribosome quality control (RQC) complex YloA/Tae2 family protein